MAFTDNFGHPKGLLGRLMLVSMDKEHLPMAEWGFTQFDMPKKADIVDIGCGGGYNIKRILLGKVKRNGCQTSEDCKDSRLQKIICKNVGTDQ